MYKHSPVSLARLLIYLGVSTVQLLVRNSGPDELTSAHAIRLIFLRKEDRLVHFIELQIQANSHQCTVHQYIKISNIPCRTYWHNLVYYPGSTQANIWQCGWDVLFNSSNLWVVCGW